MINNLIAYSRDKHLKKSGAGNKLVQGFTVGMDESGIVTVNGEVTEFQNNLGDGGAPFDFDVILGTPANLKKSISDAMLCYGANGDFGSQLNSVANSVLGDIDIRIRLALDDWVDASQAIVIIAKYNESGTDRSYMVRIAQNTGLIDFFLTTDGTDGTRFIYTSSVAPTVSDEGVLWIKITVDVDNGAANSDCTFFTSTDDTNDDTAVTFSQLGTVKNSGSVESIFNGAAPLEIGSQNLGQKDKLRGSVFRAVVRNGIDGEVVSDFNPALYVNKLTDTTFNSSLMALDMPDGVGDFGSTPDTFILRVTGNLDLRADLAPADWTPAFGVMIISKDISTQRAYRIGIASDGKLEIAISTSPGSMTFKTSTVATGFTDETRHRIRATVDVDNGAGGFDVTFFVDPADPLSPDITLKDGSTWDQLGDVVTTAGVISITAATSALQIGALNSGATQQVVGPIFKIEIYNGIDGQIVADMDASKFISGSTVTGLKRLVLPGGSGNFASTPNAAANRITGDIDVAVKVVLPDYTPASVVTFLSKFASIANQRSYVFLINTDGTLELQTFSNGQAGSVTNHLSSIPVPTLDNTVIFFRASLDVDNDAGDSECTFYTSTDGFNWTQLGEIFRSGGVVSIHPGTAPVELGSSNAGADDVMTGLMLRAVIINGIFDEGGTLAVSYNPTDFVSGTTQTSLLTSEVWTEQGGATLAEIWTANGAAAFVGQWLLNGDTFIQNTGNDVVHTIGGAALETTVGQDITTKKTVFVVARSTRNAATETLFNAKATAGKINQIFVLSNKPSLFQGITIGVSEDLLTALHVYVAEFNGDGTSKLTVVDLDEVTGDAGAFVWEFATLGANNAGANPWAGFIAAKYVYESELSEQQIEHNIGVLKTRYRISP